MKDEQNPNPKKSNLLPFIAFVTLVIFAVLQTLTLLKDILQLGTLLTNILETIKNIGIILVFGITAWNYVANKSKGLKITYWICLGIFIAVTLGLWVVYGIKVSK